MTFAFSAPRKPGASRPHLRPGSASAHRAAAARAKRVPQTPATEAWVDEGGSAVPAEGGPAPPSRKQPADTVAGCRERAAADLAAAAGAAIANQKLRFEHSAASWMLRADLIQSLNDSFEARRAASVAMWRDDEPPLDKRTQTHVGEAPHVRL